MFVSITLLCLLGGSQSFSNHFYSSKRSSLSLRVSPAMPPTDSSLLTPKELDSMKATMPKTKEDIQVSSPASGEGMREEVGGEGIMAVSNLRPPPSHVCALPEREISRDRYLYPKHVEVIRDFEDKVRMDRRRSAVGQLCAHARAPTSAPPPYTCEREKKPSYEPLLPRLSFKPFCRLTLQLMTSSLRRARICGSRRTTFPTWSARTGLSS